MAGLDLWVAIACIAVVTIGSAIQGVIGLGMGLLSAPLLAIADPAFLPLSTVIAVIPLGAGAAYREFHAVARRDVGIALAGRAVGAVAASHRRLARRDRSRCEHRDGAATGRS